MTHPPPQQPTPGSEPEPNGEPPSEQDQEAAKAGEETVRNEKAKPANDKATPKDAEATPEGPDEGSAPSGVPTGEQTRAAAGAETVTDIRAGDLAGESEGRAATEDDPQAQPPTLRTRFTRGGRASRSSPGSPPPPTEASRAASRRTEKTKAPKVKPASKKPARQRRRFLRAGWWWRWPVHSLLLLLLLFVTRGVWLAPIIASVIETQVAETLSAPHVTVRGVGGTYLTSFEIHGLRTEGEATATMVRSVALRSAEVRYSLWDLVRGEAEWLELVEVDGLVLKLDATHPPPDPQPAPEALELPPWLPQASVEDARLYVDLGAGNYLRADEVNLAVRSVGDSARVDLNAARLNGRLGELVLEPEPLSMELMRRGSQLFVTRLDWAEVRVSEPMQLELGEAVENPAWIAAHPGFAGEAGRYQPLSLAGSLELLGGSLFLDATLALPLGQTWEAAPAPWVELGLVQVDGLDLSQAQRWVGAEALPVHRGRFSLRLNGTLDLADPLGAALEVELGGGGIHARLDLAESKAALDTLETIAEEVGFVEPDFDRRDLLRLAMEQVYLEASLQQREVRDIYGMVRLGESELHLERAGLDLPQPHTNDAERVTTEGAEGSESAPPAGDSAMGIAVTDAELTLNLRGIERLPQVLALPLDWPAEMFAGIEATLSLKMQPERLHADLVYRDHERGGSLRANGWLSLPERGDRPGGESPLPVSLDKIAESLQTGTARLTGRLDWPSVQRWSEPLARFLPQLEPLRPLEGGVAGNFILEGSLDAPLLHLDLEGRNWRYRHRLIGSWDLAARYDATNREKAPRLELERFVLVGAEEMRPSDELPATADRVRAWLKAELDPKTPRLEHAFLDLRLHDLERFAWVAEMIWADAPQTRERLTPLLGGSLEASVTGRSEAQEQLADAWDVWLHGRNLRLPGEEHLTELRLDGTLEPTAAQLHSLRVHGSPGTLALAAALDWSPQTNDERGASNDRDERDGAKGLHLHVELDSLSYARQPLHWQLQRPTSGTISLNADGMLEQARLDSPLSLDGTLGQLVASVDLAAGERSRVQVQLERLPLTALPRLTRQVDPHKRLGGIVDEFSLRADGRLATTANGGVRLDELDWDMRLSAHDLGYDDEALYTTLRDVIGVDLRATAAQSPGFGEPEEVELPDPALLRVDVDVRVEGRRGEVRLREGSRAQVRLVDPEPRTLHRALALAHLTRAEPRNPLRFSAAKAPGEMLAQLSLAGRAPLAPEKLLPAQTDEPVIFAPQWYERVFGFGDVAGQARLEIPRLEAVRRLVPGLPIREGNLDLQASVSGTWRHPVASLTVRTRGAGDEPAYPIVLEQPLSEAERFRARYEIGVRSAQPIALAVDVRLGYHMHAGERSPPVGRLEVEHAQIALSGGRGYLELRGHQDLGAPWLDALFGEAEFGGAHGSASLRGSIPDLGALPLPLGRTTRLLGGRLHLDAHARGPWEAPDLAGTVSLDGVDARFSDAVPPVRNANLTVKLGADQIQIPEFRAMLGGSELTGNAKLELADELLEHRIHLELAGRDLPLMRQDEMSIRTDLDLLIAGRLGDEQDPLTISGSLDVVRGLIRQDVNFFSFLQPARPQVVDTDFRIQGVELEPFAPGQQPIRLNLAVSTRPPRAAPGTVLPTIELRTNVVSANISTRLNIGGTLATPDVRGTVNVDEVDVSLPTGWMRVDSATLTFDGRPFPQLRFEARMSMHGYEITGRFEGTLDRAETLIQHVTFTSRPPLPEDQVLLMVLTGNPPEEIQDLRGDHTAAVQRVAVYIGQDLLRRMFGGDPEIRRQILDRLRIEPGTTLSQSGEPMFTVTFRLIDDLFNVGNRDVENPVMLVFSRDRFDDFNAGISYTIRLR